MVWREVTAERMEGCEGGRSQGFGVVWQMRLAVNRRRLV